MQNSDFFKNNGKRLGVWIIFYCKYILPPHAYTACSYFSSPASLISNYFLNLIIRCALAQCRCLEKSMVRLQRNDFLFFIFYFYNKTFGHNWYCKPMTNVRPPCHRLNDHVVDALVVNYQKPPELARFFHDTLNSFLAHFMCLHAFDNCCL